MLQLRLKVWVQQLAKLPKFLDFKKECSRVGTTEEAIANAEKIGFKTDLEAEHPFIEGKKIPIYVSNFILSFLPCWMCV